jgi:hypothetical protein
MLTQGRHKEVRKGQPTKTKQKKKEENYYCTAKVKHYTEGAESLMQTYININTN